MLGARGSVTRWATGVLAVATAALLLYVVALVVMGWLAVAAFAVLRPSSSLSVDVPGMFADAAPALLVGWCVGRAAAACSSPVSRCPRRPGRRGGCSVRVPARCVTVLAGARPPLRNTRSERASLVRKVGCRGAGKVR